MAASGEHAVDDADIEERVNALLVGAIDMHCHSGPSVMPRMIDHIEALEEASAAGMKALLFKGSLLLGHSGHRIAFRPFPSPQRDHALRRPA